MLLSSFTAEELEEGIEREVRRKFVYSFHREIHCCCRSNVIQSTLSGVLRSQPGPDKLTSRQAFPSSRLRSSAFPSICNSLQTTKAYNYVSRSIRRIQTACVGQLTQHFNGRTSLTSAGSISGHFPSLSARRIKYRIDSLAGVGILAFSPSVIISPLMKSISVAFPARKSSCIDDPARASTLKDAAAAVLKRNVGRLNR